MARIHLFYYEWPSTAGNHGGMAYFAQCLKRDLGWPVALICVPQKYGRYRSRLQWLWRVAVIRYSTIRLAPDDIFLLSEYLGGRTAGDQRAIALELRARGIRNPIVGLVHLPAQTLTRLYDQAYINSALDAVDQIVVLGSGLANYFRSIGYSNKVMQTFYYVDTDYFSPSERKTGNGTFVVFDGGTLFRNSKMVCEIVQRCPQFEFEICMGRSHLEPLLSGLPNVRLHKFLREDEFYSKMRQADVSLSAFDDTLGSNTITLSLACGKPQVVSDVGSVRNYCSEENAFFCRDVDDFVRSLHLLCSNSELRRKMGASARRRAEEISLQASIRWYRDLFGSLAYTSDPNEV